MKNIFILIIVLLIVSSCTNTMTPEEDKGLMSPCVQRLTIEE